MKSKKDMKPMKEKGMEMIEKLGSNMKKGKMPMMKTAKKKK